MAEEKKHLSKLCGTVEKQVLIINSIPAAKSTSACQDWMYVQDDSSGIPWKSHQSLNDKSLYVDFKVKERA